MSKFDRATNNSVVLLVTLLVLLVWGFAAFNKMNEGVPQWFIDLFKNTLLAKMPGLSASFWFVTTIEATGCALALCSLVRLEFLKPRLPLLRLALLTSIGIFLALEFGTLLAGDLAGQERLFNYFVLNVVMYVFVDRHERTQAGH